MRASLVVLDAFDGCGVGRSPAGASWPDLPAALVSALTSARLGDDAWTNRYYDLLEEIGLIEEQVFGKRGI